MLLADIDIRKALKSGDIKAYPGPILDEALSACALDLRLGYEFEVFEHTKFPYFDIKNPGKISFTKKMSVQEGQPFIMQPGEFALGSTLETIELPDNIAGRLEGRSSLGRLGVVVHATAALIHPGMKGKIVLELGNHARMAVAIYPGMRICSVSFEKLTQSAAIPYSKQKNAKYFNQPGVTGSKIGQEV